MGEKVTDQTEDTSPTYDDLLYGVNDPGGTAASRKISVQSAVNSLEINAQTGTTYTTVIGDRAKLITMDNAATNTLTIPLNSSVAYPVGTCLLVKQKGAGVTSVTGATGVTLEGAGASVSGGTCAISARYDIATFIKVATDTWNAAGPVGTIA
jgi:hypothetical protein